MLQKQIIVRKAYIRELVKAIENSNSPFFLECMFYCLEEEKAKLKKDLKDRK